MVSIEAVKIWKKIERELSSIDHKLQGCELLSQYRQKRVEDLLRELQKQVRKDQFPTFKRFKEINRFMGIKWIFGLRRKTLTREELRLLWNIVHQNESVGKNNFWHLYGLLREEGNDSLAASLEKYEFQEIRNSLERNNEESLMTRREIAKKSAGVVAGLVLGSSNLEGEDRGSYGAIRGNYKEMVNQLDRLSVRYRILNSKKTLTRQEQDELRRLPALIRLQRRNLQRKMNYLVKAKEIALNFVKQKQRKKEISMERFKGKWLIYKRLRGVLGRLGKKQIYDLDNYLIDVANSFTLNRAAFPARFKESLERNSVEYGIVDWISQQLKKPLGPLRDAEDVKKHIQAITQFLHDNVEYLYDNEGPAVEQRTPYAKAVPKNQYWDLHKSVPQMIIDGGGDCDDYSLTAIRLLLRMHINIEGGWVRGTIKGEGHAVVGLILPKTIKNAKQVFSTKDITYKGKKFLVLIEPQNRDADPPDNKFIPKWIVLPDGTTRQL